MSEATVAWILSLAKGVLMTAALWLVWTLRNAFVAGMSIQKFINRFDAYERETDKALAGLRKDYERDATECKRRMDQAGTEMSTLATDVQGLPERMRKEFLTLRESEFLAAQSRVDRQRLHDDLAAIWKVINRRDEEGRRR